MSGQASDERRDEARDDKTDGAARDGADAAPPLPLPAGGERGKDGGPASAGESNPVPHHAAASEGDTGGSPESWQPEAEDHASIDQDPDGNSDAFAAAVRDARAGDADEALLEAFEKEVADARRLADEQRDLYLRAEADLQNLRRVGEARRSEAVTRTKRELLARFLEIADDLEKALDYGDADHAALLEGIRATMRAFEIALDRAGVARIEAEGAPFDPIIHEAVAVVPMPDLDEERVISVERAGYVLGDELLRPARVVVGRPQEG